MDFLINTQQYIEIIRVLTDWGLIIIPVVLYLRGVTVRYMPYVALTSDICNLNAPTQQCCKRPFRDDWKQDICCAWRKSFSPERRQHCHLRFSSPRSPCCYPPPVGLLPPEYENTLSLHKSFPQLHFSPCFFWLWQMRLGHEVELLELSMQDGKAGTNKSHLSLFTREVWEQPHYTVAWINLGPLSLRFTLGTWYNEFQCF